MDWKRVEGNWNEVKGKVKEKWRISLRTTTSLPSTANATS
jgi:hypothetical protein